MKCLKWIPTTQDLVHIQYVQTPPLNTHSDIPHARIQDFLPGGWGGGGGPGMTARKQL